MRSNFKINLILLLFIFYSLPVWAICHPDENCNGTPTICSVIGQVTKIQDDPPFALIHLGQLYGSSTMGGCKMKYNVDVNVPLNIQPKPQLSLNDFVVVYLRPSGISKGSSIPEGSSVEMMEPETLHDLLVDFKYSSNSRSQQLACLYQIKSYLRNEKTIEELDKMLLGDQGYLAARVLIILAKEKYPVPPSILKQAMNEQEGRE